MSLEEAITKIRAMYDDPLLELTQEELSALRSSREADRARIGEKGYTCDNCNRSRTCPYVFDLYNAGEAGDCLAAK